MIGIKGCVLNSVKSICNATSWFSASRFSTFTQPLYIRLTPALMGEPLKKKKKVDPAVMRAREERKRRKLWKECRRLMKQAKQLKPIDEINIPYVLIDEKANRTRKSPTLTTETLEYRADLLRQWCAYRNKRRSADYDMIDRMYRAQEKALKELKFASPKLYEEAIKLDPSIFPLTLKGPTYTPPIKDYDSPDGEYIDITRKWEAPKISEVELRKRQKEKMKESRLKE